MRAFDLAMSHDEQGELANNIVKQLTNLNKKDMRTEKIKDNPTRIEELEWLLKCAKHYEAGGKIKHEGLFFLKANDGGLRFSLSPQRYEIVLEPEYRPYKTVEEVPVGKAISSKDKKHKTIIAEAFTRDVDKGSLSIMIGSDIQIESKIILQEYTFEDGSPVGVEVEE